MLVGNVLFHEGRSLKQLLTRLTSIFPFILLFNVLLTSLAQFPGTP
jgi:hypothetical protein